MAIERMLDGGGAIVQRAAAEKGGLREVRFVVQLFVQLVARYACVARRWLVVGMTLSAAAQQPTPEQISAIRASCRSDFISHCAGVQPGTRDAVECLKRNSAKVSPACKTALDAVSPRPTESAAPAPAKAAPAPTVAPPPPPAAAAPVGAGGSAGSGNCGR